MGVISQAGGSQGSVESLNKAFFDRIEKLTKEMEALPPKDPRRATLEAKIKDEWAKYGEKQGALAKQGELEVNQTEEGEEENAVQEQGANEGNVRKSTRGGKKVGETNAKPEKPARKSTKQEANKEPVEPKEVKSDNELAGEAWDKVASEYPEAPKWADLTKEQQKTFTDFGPKNWTAQDVQGELVKLAKKQFGENTTKGVKNPYSVAELTDEIKTFIRADILGRKLKIVENVQQLLLSPDREEQIVGAAMGVNGAYGVATNGTAYLIANRIEKGTGRAKFMHEVGAHLGLEKLLPTAIYNKLTEQIASWAKSDNGSVESTLAVKAAERVMNANTPKEDQRSEMLAYFIEEAMQAGIDPTAAGKESAALSSWFRTLWAAFKNAVRKLGFKEANLTAQDVVNLAFGAARLEITGTWHGTAASFRKFNHKFMGSGEGAQAYGWGTYLAQRVGIAHGYWKADVQRKTSPVEVLYNGKDIDHIATDLFFKSNLTKDEKALLNIVTELSLQAGVGNTDSIRTVHLNLAKKLNKTAEEKYASEWLDKHYSDFSTKSTAPLGSLLRVDVGVGQNDLLDWDEPLSKQPNILKAIKNNLSSDVISTLEEEYNDDLDNLTGEDFYRGLQALEKRDGLISDQFKDVEDYNKRLGNKGAKQIVSTYLDEIAKVPGIKFLDAMSRVAGPEKKLVFHGVKYTSDELRHLVKEAREGKGTLTLDQVTNLRHVLHVGINAALEEYKKKIQRTIDSSVQIYKESSERFKVPYNEAEALARAKATAEKTYEAQQLKWLEDNLKNIDVTSKEKVRTKNLVVFNDKNIQRVGSEIAADRQRMKFGIDQATVDKNINKLPPRIQKPTRVITDSLFKQAISKMGAFKNLVLKSAITEDVVKYAQKYMRSADKYLAAQYARQAMVNKFNTKVDKILTAYEKLDKAIQGEGAGSVNEFIADSTLSGKWGYYPGAKFVGTKLFEVDPDMEKRFKAFEKYEGAQELIKSVFEHGHDVLMAKQAAATKAVDAEFAERERQAFFDPDILDQLRAEKKAAIAKISLGDPTVPYAPLNRYGDYVVIAKSAEYQAYEDMLSGERGMATGNNDIVGDANRARIWMDENQSNSTHYIVQFAETLGEANKIAQDLGATGLYDNVQSGEKETQASYAGGSDIHLAVARLRNLFKRSTENKNTPEAKALDKMIGDLYLLATAENSARKSEIERKKISGFDKNMMRNLATSGKANAHFLASMEHNDAINESIDEMRQQAKANRAEAMPYFNELMERNAASMNYKSPSIIAKSLNQANHIYSLTFSPAFYLQQMVQTAAISLPYLAGRLGYTNAAKHIGRAYQDVSKIKNALDFKNVNDHLDFSKAPADVRAMLDRLVGMGKIDIGMDSEFKAKGYDQTLFDKVMYKMQGITNRIEAVNRSVAAIAAYRGYLERYGMDKVEGATQYAADVVSDTHGSYDGFNTPRVLQSTFGKVALQFRRFQIIQLSMMAKMIHTAFIENSASKEEKLVAKKTLAFICAQMAVVAGGLGVPFVSQLAFLMLKMFGSPDEPDDVEYKLRKLIGDPVAAELLLRGVSGAVGWESFGKKISMENVASPFGGYVTPDLTNRKGVEKTALAILGPSLSLTEKLADAFQYTAQGNYYKGLEAALPNGLSNSLKGARYLTEGMTMRNGDLVMKPDDVGMLGAASQMFGLPTNAITHQQFAQKVKAEYDQMYQERLTEIKGEYVKSYRANDSKGMANAREEFRQMEESRMANGYKRQPLSELLKAPMAAMKRERSVVNGVESTKQNKQFLATMGA